MDPSAAISAATADDDPTASQGGGRPRLVYFQSAYDERLPPFLLTHKREHVTCLSHFFDVTVIHDDADYRQVCELHEPDLVLFESGVNHPSCRRLRISGTNSNPQIPKLALHHGDAFCNARAGLISDIESWGIDTVFSIATTAGEHLPELSDRLFYWPVFIDPSVFHDYGEWKSVPVLLTGNTSPLYPWRNAVFPILSHRFATLSCPHPGYDPGGSFINVLSGERYARTLNASWFVPACGTVAKECVRKHFEVPASGACLVTERSPVLDAAGFVDMENCVFADAADIRDKVEALLAEPERLNALIDAGHRLVHTRHTSRHRNQIAEWHRLHATGGSGQRIVQTNPFSAPILVPSTASLRTRHVASRGVHLQWLERGDLHLAQEDYAQAEACYLQCANYLRWMPEPKIRLARCSLHLGDARQALEWLREPLKFTLDTYKAASPDPVEWAHLLLALVCKGDVQTAFARASCHTGLRHPELDRARWLCDVVSGKRPPAPVHGASEAHTPSLHVLPPQEFPQWRREVARMLRACGQERAALLVEGSALVAEESVAIDAACAPAAPSARDSSTVFGAGSIGTTMAPLQARLKPWAGSVRRQLGPFLHRLEQRFGYFLPFEQSSIRRHRLYGLVFDTSRRSRGSIVIVGAEPQSRLMRLVLAGVARNPALPSILIVCCPAASSSRKPPTAQLSTSTPVTVFSHPKLQEALQGAFLAGGKEGVDMVIIDCASLGRVLGRQGLAPEPFRESRLVLVVGANSIGGYLTVEAFRKGLGHEVLAEDAGQAGGYAIFAAPRKEPSPASVGQPPRRPVPDGLAFPQPRVGEL